MDEPHDQYEIILYTKEEELRLIQRAQAGDMDVRNRLVENYMPAATAFAKRYSRSKCFDQVDLIQEGAIGIMSAIKRYDPKYGARLLTYLYWWFQATMGRFVRKNRAAINLPEKMTDEKMKELYRYGVQTLGKFEEGLTKEEALNDFELYDNFEELEFWLTKAKKWLHDRQYEAIVLRSEGKKLDDIAERLGVTRERARQILDKALEKLKRREGESIAIQNFEKDN